MTTETGQDIGLLLEDVETDEELSAADRAEIKAVLAQRTSTPAAQEAKPKPETSDLRSEIADMRIPEKIKLAMFGDSVVRGLLIGDSNRLVQAAVLNNPQLRDTEVEAFARNRNMPEFVLRGIGKNKSWMKSYGIKYNLVTNPKTPQDIAMKWLRHILKADLRKIAKSKNVPNIISITARKRLAQMESKG